MEHTIAAISTSTMSSGGISIVRMSGKDAIETADKIFVKTEKNCLKSAAILFIMEILLMKTVIL